MILHGYMSFPTVKGISESENHKNWFHIDSYSFSILNELKTPFQNKNHHGNFSAITVTRTVDEASSQIMGAVSCMDIGDCSIMFSKAEIEEASSFITINLKNAQITSYHTEVSRNGTLTEHISIHYSAIVFDYSPISGKNKEKPKYSFKCNLEK